jgi:hypothetical protein
MKLVNNFAEGFPKKAQQWAKLILLLLFGLFHHDFFYNPYSITKDYCDEIHSSLGAIE